MAKKSAKTKSHTKHKPEPAQIGAIERLLERRDYAGAVAKIKPLVKRFPDHSGLHRSLVEALQYAESLSAAGLAAFAWAERRPNSLPAQQALLHFAMALRHVMLADRAASKVRELGGETPGFPLDPAVRESMLALPDGTRTSVEVMERFDIGKLHLEATDFAGALHWFDGLELIPARNNYALALFHEDRIAEALDAFMSSWQRDPDNLFALGWAVRLRLYTGDTAGARGLCTPLAATKARRVEDALFQLDALLLLQEDQSAWDAFEHSAHADWPDFGMDIGSVTLRHYGACAASRLGKSADARRLWREALAAHPKFMLARTNLDQIDPNGTSSRFPAVFEFSQTLPLTWTAALRIDPEKVAGKLNALTASNTYLEALYLGGDQTLRTLIGFILKHRAEQSDSDAAGLLRRFTSLPVGTKDERFAFLSFLQRQHLLRHGESVEIWDGDCLREVKLIDTEVYREASQSDLPPDLEALLNEAVVLFNDRQPDAAETRLTTILQQVPDHPVALGNLAAVRNMQGRDEEAVNLLRQVVTKHPDYLFGRCNLAKTLIMEGENDEAEQLLKGLAERERLHIQEFFTLYGTLAMLHSAKGDDETAQSYLATLKSMVEDEDDERRLMQVQRAIDRLDPGKRFKQLFETLFDSRSKAKKRR